MSTQAGTAPATVFKQEAPKAALLQVAILVLAVVGLGVQILGIYFDVTWHTLEYTSDIKIDPNLTVTRLGTGAEAAGFRVGDQLVAFDGQEIGTILDYRRALNSQEHSSWSEVTIRRGSELRALPVFVMAQSPDLQFVVRNVIALALLVMGTLAAFQHPEDRSARLFFLAACALALYFSLQDKEVVGLVYLQAVVLAMAPAFALHFFLSFPEERWPARSRWWPVLYVPSLVLMAFSLGTFRQAVRAGTGIFRAPSFQTLTTIGFGYLILITIIGLFTMGYTYVTSAQPILRRQLQWVMWGLACALLTSAADITLTLLKMQSYEIWGLLLLGLIPLPVAIAFAIMRYRLLDVDLVVNRSVVYGLLTAVLAALYLLLISVLSNALGMVAGSSGYTLLLFLSALLIGILVTPLRSRIQAFIDKAFYRRQVSYRHALIQWSQELGTSLRFADLAHLMLRDVPKELMIKRAALLVLDRDETSFLPLSASDSDIDAKMGPDARLAISAHGAMAARLLQPGMILDLKGERQGTASSDPRASDSPRSDRPPGVWEQAGFQFVFPLISAGRLVGMYLVGRKRSDDIYLRQELDLLRTLSNQAAVAIANARLYEEVHASSQELEDKVQERTRELRDFLSAVYHELRTPITTIRGYTALMLDGKAGPLTEKQTRYLMAARRSVGRLLGLVTDLSDVSKIDDGRLTIVPEPLDLGVAISETMHPLTHIVEEKGLQVHITIRPEAVMVRGDPQRVVQILTNLVSNACRYTPVGGQVTISVEKVGNFALLAVRDTGIGIDEDELQHIFERFYRSSDPLVQEQPGTGLGLAVTKSLVELHGSQLWVESTPGKGSAFGFSLPLAQAADEAPLEDLDGW